MIALHRAVAGCARRRRSRWPAWLLLCLCYWLAAGATAAPPCGGDCSGDGAVAISELVTCVNVALGARRTCAACDGDGNGVVAINDLIAAVNHALRGCPAAPPTPTATPPAATATVSPTAPPPTATASATATMVPIGDATATASRTAGASATPTSLPTARGAFRDVAVSAQGATRLALASLEWFDLLDATTDAAQAAAACPGHVTIACTPSAASAVRSITYAGCETTTPSGHVVRRDGAITQSVDNPGFCSAATIGLSDTVTLRLQDYEQTEQLSDTVLVRIDADLTVVSAGLGSQGCAGRNAAETLDGMIHVACSAAAESVRCPARGADVTLTPHDLMRRQQSGGAPCSRLLTADGSLGIADIQTGEEFQQGFDDFEVMRTAAGGEPDRVTLNGTMSADCLGTVTVGTQPETALRLPAGDVCPVDGMLDVGRPGPAGAAGAERARTAAGARGSGAIGVQQRLYRAARGQVYQVLQNPGAAASLGAEAAQITTLVGAAASVAECANAADALSPPQAVAAATGGRAVPIEMVLKSPRLAGATAPCFNRNAEAGSGRLCFGTGCTADCACPAAAPCASFALADGVPLTQASADVPAAGLVAALPPLADPCSGFAGRSTYRFGSGGPTTQTQVCGSAPVDGLRLPNGSSVAFVYDSAPLALFNAGFGGFPVDLDGQNTIGCAGPVGAGRVLNAGNADQLTAAAARIEFAAGAAAFDYDGDQRPDKTLSDCAAGPLIACASEPAPTPTPDPDQPCGPTLLAASTDVAVQGSTRGALDQTGEASCGWGGGAGAPDRTYQFTAPESGRYDVHATGSAGFDPYLYVRDGTCLPEREELGCDDDGGSAGSDALLSVDLAAGRQVAIVVDGADPTGGGFTLEVHERQPDLVVNVVTANPTASAGEGVNVAALVTNVGDGGATAFRVQLVFARDEAGTQVLGGGAVTCAITGLGPGQQTTCLPGSTLFAPLVAPGQYFISARADVDGEIRERNEANNTNAAPIVLAVPGADLQQELYRARDGTAYQLIYAVPRVIATAAARYRVTTVAAAVPNVQSCELSPLQAGEIARAVSGSDALPLFDAMRRTALLQPNDATQVRFDPDGGGRLTLGLGSGATNICARSDACTGLGSVPLELVTQVGGGLPAACAPVPIPGAECAGVAVPASIGFGGQQQAGECLVGSLTVETEICAAEPADGFALGPGQSVVFVYEAGRDSLQTAVGGFGISASPTNPPGCLAGRVIEAHARLTQSERQPLLSLLDVVRDTSAIDFNAVAVSPDSAYVYAVSPDRHLLAAFRRESDGTLVEVDSARDGVDGVDGLDIATDLVVSPDGQHLYVTSEGEQSVAVFERNSISGAIHFTQLRRDGVGGVDGLAEPLSIAISPDGLHVYVAGHGDDSVTLFQRDTATGRLTFIELRRQGVGGIEGLAGVRALTLSPDGAYLYALSESALAVFARNPLSGRLIPVEVQRNAQALLGATDLAIAPGGQHLYVTSTDTGQQSALATFRRDATSGKLAFMDVLRNPLADPLDGARSVAVSADGRSVYVASTQFGGINTALSIFGRDPTSGALTARGTADGVALNQFDGPRSVAVSPDDTSVYVARTSSRSGVHQGGVSVYARASIDGSLTFLESQTQDSGVHGISIGGVAASPDGANLYVPSSGDGGITYGRDPVSGRLRFVGVDEHPVSSYVFSPDLRFVYGDGGSVRFGRDRTSGALTFLGSQPEAEGNATISPDGKHLYVSRDDALRTFQRDPDSGLLSLLDTIPASGPGEMARLAVSPDGAHVYAAREFDSSIQVFGRDATSGRLSFVEEKRDGQGGVDGLAGVSAIAISGDGRHVYATGPDDTAVAVFARNSASGALSFVEVQRDGEGGVQGLGPPRAVAVSPDGNLVFVASFNSVAVFARDVPTGSLDFLEAEPVGNGLDGIQGFAVLGSAPQHVYVSGGFDSGIALFQVIR